LKINERFSKCFNKKINRVPETVFNFKQKVPENILAKKVSKTDLFKNSESPQKCFYFTNEK
jgi:hypothetical protein